MFLGNFDIPFLTFPVVYFILWQIIFNDKKRAVGVQFSINGKVRKPPVTIIFFEIRIIISHY